MHAVAILACIHLCARCAQSVGERTRVSKRFLYVCVCVLLCVG